jgi:hypothetical protein
MSKWTDNENLDGLEVKLTVFFTRFLIDKYILTAIKTDVEWDVFLRSYVASMSFDFLSTDSEPVQYPSNWIEAVKDRFLPEWLKRRFPVKYTVITPTHMFPDNTELGRECVRLLKQNLPIRI